MLILLLQKKKIKINNKNIQKYLLLFKYIFDRKKKAEVAVQVLVPNDKI